MTDQPDLFDMAQGEPAQAGAAIRHAAAVVAFPLRMRVGKIRDVAKKLLATKSDRHAASYRAQVTEAMQVNLTSKHVPAEVHAGEIASFWRAVDLEAARIAHGQRERV